LFDHGLLRQNEGDEVMDAYKSLGLHVIRVNAAAEFSAFWPEYVNRSKNVRSSATTLSASLKGQRVSWAVLSS
jgi:GMP synthase PP-ATPase subunit